MTDNIKLRKKLALLTTLALTIIMICFFAPQLCPFDPYAQDLAKAMQSPNWHNILGTDRYGRDILSRIIVGSRASVFSAFLLVTVITIFGSFMGVVCGWQGGKTDAVIMRISDVFLAFPGLVFALAVIGVLGGGMSNAIIALGVISWPKYARLARSLTLSTKNAPYIAAARLSGSNNRQIIYRHILPNISGQLVVTGVLDIGTMMMELAGLSFLGLGAQPPLAEWGSMMSEGRSMLQTTPWVVLSPGLAIFLTVFVFNLLGDTVRDYLDPKERHKISISKGEKVICKRKKSWRG